MATTTTPVAAAGSRAWTWPWWALPLGIFVLSRGVDLLLVAQAATHQAASLPGHGPFVFAARPASPGWLSALTNWDGQWYEQIARHGYPTTLPRSRGVVTQNPWAFYPGYPGLVRGVMVVTGLSFAVAATAVSTLCGALAVCLVHRLLLPAAGLFGAATTVLALCVFPSAALFSAAYTESLGLLLVVLMLGAVVGRRYAVVAALAVVCSLVRPIVLPIAAVLVVHGLSRWWRRDREAFPVRERISCALAALVAALSFAIWPAVTAVVTHDPRAYLETQAAWRRSSDKLSWARAARELWDLTPVLPIAAALAAVAVLVVVIVRPGLRSWRPELRAWAVLYSAYTLVATRPELSLLRYAMLTGVPWWPQTDTGPRRAATRRLTVAGVVVVGLVGQFLWVRYVLVPDPRYLLAP